jgi:hypothetical protein
MVGCGDDDDDGAVDNVAACENLMETLNGLECVADDYDWGWDCEIYGDTTCDISEYFDCLADGYTCTDDDPPMLDATGAADCTLTEC